MKAKLIVIGGTTSATEVNLRLPTIIGRGRSAEVTIPHSLVSRQHCKITESGGRLVVRDLDSLNGTYVGDERITETILEPGALLTVGTVTFRAVYEIGSSDESQSTNADDTSCAAPATSAGPDSPLDSERERFADAETVPVDATSIENSLLPPLASASDRSTPEAETADVADLLDASSLESAASNPD
ncbi:MAG: FHA domain-containing protein [Planctomycetes bacterium]|nr:FHA domain-containing protein [Planctomycetota bacterium]